MSPGAPRKLEQYVETEVSDTRASLLWQRVSSSRRLRAARITGPRGWQALALIATTVVIALLVARRVDHRPHEASPWSDTDVPKVVYDDTGAMMLADGSRIRLRDEGRVRLEKFEPRTVELTLEHGTAEVQVVHVAGRRFVVHAGTFDLIDIGTRFVVSLDEGAVRLTVEEGRVELHDVSGALPVRVLAAGESWSSGAAVTPPSNAPAPSAAPAQSSALPTMTPKQLFEAADAARIAGRPRDAATLLDRLRHQHRHDARAALAAFQLGRLRLDSLGDATGAVEAFDDAIALAPDAPLREDAEARRVEALERASDPRCREARDNYLARYPGGVHVKEVSARCGR